MCVGHSPWEIVDPYPVLVNHNAGGHHPNENFCVTLVLKVRGTEHVRSVLSRWKRVSRAEQRHKEEESTTGGGKKERDISDRPLNSYKTREAAEIRPAPPVGPPASDHE